MTEAFGSKASNEFLEALNSTDQFTGPVDQFIMAYNREHTHISTDLEQNAVISVFFARRFVDELLDAPFKFNFKAPCRDNFEEYGSEFLVPFARATAARIAEKSRYKEEVVNEIRSGFSREELDEGAGKFVEWIKDILKDNGEKLLREVGLIC